MDLECCEVQGRKFSLNNVHLNLPFTNVILHLDDLKVANHKVEEVENWLKNKIGNWDIQIWITIFPFSPMWEWLLRH